MSATQNYTFAPRTITFTLEQLVQIEIALMNRMDELEQRITRSINIVDMRGRNFERMDAARAALKLVRGE